MLERIFLARGWTEHRGGGGSVIWFMIHRIYMPVFVLYVILIIGSNFFVSEFLIFQSVFQNKKEVFICSNFPTNQKKRGRELIWKRVLFNFAHYKRNFFIIFSRKPITHLLLNGAHSSSCLLFYILQRMLLLFNFFGAEKIFATAGMARVESEMTLKVARKWAQAESLLSGNASNYND